MSRYIDFYLIGELVDSHGNVHYEDLKNLPTADVVERKHGEWIDGLDVPKKERERHPYVYLHGEKYCSVCYKEAYFDTDYGQQLFDFCPNCGSRMDERREDAEAVNTKN